jgi:hypothetical protein
MALNTNLKNIVDFSKGNGLVTAIARTRRPAKF